MGEIISVYKFNTPLASLKRGIASIEIVSIAFTISIYQYQVLFDVHAIHLPIYL